MTPKIRKQIILIITGAVIYFAAIVLPLFLQIGDTAELILFLASYLIIGRSVIRKTAQNLANGVIFDENFLMVVASAGAFVTGSNAEAVAVMLFYQIGEIFEKLAVNRSRRSISELMDIRPETARVKRGSGWEEVKPEEVHPGDVIQIKPGERVPLDGVVSSGSGSIDTQQLTGESMPRDIGPGEVILSGSVNQSSVLLVTVSKEYGESTVARILDLVENAGSRKAASENFITKFARYYTPAVVLSAAVLAVIPSVMTGDWHTWVYRGLTFLVISCPCALVISIPLTFFGGIGASSHRGILVKGSNYLETLAKADTFVFDKTGTLTKGTFEVKEIVSYGMPKEKLLELAACAEQYSSHPIAASLRAEYGKEIQEAYVKKTEEIPGNGVSAEIAMPGEQVRSVKVGNARMMKESSADFKEEKLPGTVSYVSVDGVYAGYILIGDILKEDAEAAIASLKHSGVRRCIMLTGDNETTAAYAAGKLGLTGWFAELLPGDKVTHVEELLSGEDREGALAYVGDGMNDAPVLARADVGVAMGALGSDAAIEAADVVIMDDQLSKLSLAVKIARKTLKIVRENIVFSLAVKAAILVLAAVGLADMWAAVFADVGVMMIAVLNAVRILRIRF